MRLFLALLFVSFNAHGLTGTVSSATGEKMAGVAVSAKGQGSTITTSVYTDKAGNYSFSPLPAGKYRVWAQAIGYGTAKAELQVVDGSKQNLKLVANTEAEQTFRQLPGNLALAALPEENEHDKRMKQLVRNGCTSCHTASYPLQFRIDEAGWTAIIELMKNANVYGSYMAKERGKPTGLLDQHQKELTAHLARARGPTRSPTTVIDP